VQSPNVLKDPEDEFQLWKKESLTKTQPGYGVRENWVKKKTREEKEKRWGSPRSAPFFPVSATESIHVAKRSKGSRQRFYVKQRTYRRGKKKGAEIERFTSALRATSSSWEKMRKREEGWVKFPHPPKWQEENTTSAQGGGTRWGLRGLV